MVSCTYISYREGQRFQKHPCFSQVICCYPVPGNVLFTQNKCQEHFPKVHRQIILKTAVFLSAKVYSDATVDDNGARSTRPWLVKGQACPLQTWYNLAYFIPLFCTPKVHKFLFNSSGSIYYIDLQQYSFVWIPGSLLINCVSVSIRKLQRSLPDLLYLDFKACHSCMARQGPSWVMLPAWRYSRSRPATKPWWRCWWTWSGPSCQPPEKLAEWEWYHWSCWRSSLGFVCSQFLLNLPFSGICVQMVTMHHQPLF